MTWPWHLQVSFLGLQMCISTSNYDTIPHWSLHHRQELQPSPALLCQCIWRQTSSLLCCCTPLFLLCTGHSSPALSHRVCGYQYICLFAIQHVFWWQWAHSAEAMELQESGSLCAPRRGQQQTGSVLAIYNHLPFSWWPLQLLGAADSQGFHVAFPLFGMQHSLLLPTLSLSAVCMHLYRPELYQETRVYLEPVVNQGVYPCSFLASCSSLVLQQLLNLILLNQSCKIVLFLSPDVSLVFKCWQVCKHLKVFGTFIERTQRNYYISAGEDLRAKICLL